MKPKDYMIGDILMAHLDDEEKDFPVVINGLDENGTLVDGDCEFSWRPLNKEDDDIQYADALFSIPLTPEILEKNGWLFIEGQDYSTFPVPSRWICQFVPFELRVNRGHYTIANTFTIAHVHELQHILHLCGLNDLAGNFKI